MNIPAKILIVDDREANLVALRAGLHGCDCEIEEALAGAAAIEKAAHEDFAAILLDVQMPQIDGFEVARQIRASARNVSTPIIFLTAIEREERYERLGYTVGAVDYLFKPINIEILQSKVGIFLELYRKNIENMRQAELLKQAALREQENLFLKQSLELRDEFLTMAAHELNTPITPLNLQIQSFIQMYRDGSIHDAPKEIVLRLLETSESQVHRLSRLINDLVDVSRIRVGRIEIQKAGMELSSLVKNIVSSFREECESVGCEVTLTAETSGRGHWDSFRIEQVVINLLKNSLKYGAGKPIQLRIWEKDGDVYLSVRDKGIGIPDIDQMRIFERFERAASSRNYGGLGLGLYISDQIVRLHGGEIRVESEPGQGAEFVVRLPKAGATASASLPSR